MKYGDARYNYQYAALKDFMSKHVAHIYNNDLDGDKISESLTDIAVYCIIASVMFDEHYAERCHINPEDVTNANG